MQKFRADEDLTIYGRKWTTKENVKTECNCMVIYTMYSTCMHKYLF